MSGKSITISVSGSTSSYALEGLGSRGGGISAGDIVEAVYSYLEKNPVEQLADNSFYATYGTTTSAEIEAAYQAGKKLYCLKGDAICPLFEYYGPTMVCFYRGGFYIYCNNSEWMENCPYDISTNKTQVIDEESTDAQYPSAKAVYEAIKSIETDPKENVPLSDKTSGDSYNISVTDGKLMMKKVESEV